MVITLTLVEYLDGDARLTTDVEFLVAEWHGEAMAAGPLSELATADGCGEVSRVL